MTESLTLPAALSTRPLVVDDPAVRCAAGHRRVSLAVHAQNPAIALYERCGFRKRDCATRIT